MSRIVFLDSEPVGLASQAQGKPKRDLCRDWLLHIESEGWEIRIPEIVDYEVRRELRRIGATAALTRLDLLIGRYLLVPVNRDALLCAADLWASLRRKGIPTSNHDSLDADAILAGQALTSVDPDRVPMIATSNLRHPSRFPGIEARHWQSWS